MPMLKNGGMPPTGGRLGIRQSRYVKAQLTRAYQKGGRHYIDAHNAKGAGGWTGVPVVEFGGGAGRFMHMPIAGDQGDGAPALAVGEESDPTNVASAQVWLFFDGSSNFPVCVGAVQHPKRGLVTDTPITGEDEDRSSEIGVKDFALVNGEASFVVDANGVIAAKPKANSSYQIILPSGSRARISRGAKAEERVLLGRKASQHLRDTTAVRKSMDKRLKALEDAMFEVITALDLGLTETGIKTVSPGISFSAVIAVAEPAEVDDTMLSDALQISKDEMPAGIT